MEPLSRVRKPNLHSDRGQDSNLCAWRPLRPQSTHGSTVPWQPYYCNKGMLIGAFRKSHQPFFLMGLEGDDVTLRSFFTYTRGRISGEASVYVPRRQPSSQSHEKLCA
ncbi:hypothetical protein E2C01_006329 [Portunus trituberculatus]|uniref:Uncharacterized protein n=1 Tax=Portunus trituberculatus TaxID=210409 RepID=A0A5B7CUX9_PORTR|nr:hypothetical protein [Portunus trituberculatus]